MLKRFPGGGNNDRKAARLLPTDGGEGTVWEPCEFEELKPGDVAMVFDSDNTVCCNDEGCCTFVVMTLPAKDSSGIWGMSTVSCLDLARLQVPKP